MAVPPRRVLLVIDVQHEYVDGALPIAFPPLTTSLASIAAAIAVAHDAGVPVLLVQHVDAVDSPVFAEGSRGAALLGTVAAAPHDAVLVKDTVSVFPSTDLADRLGDADTLTIAGFMTQHCVESTARDAADRGLAVEVLSDATGAPPLATPQGALSAEEVHEGALRVLASGFASVATTAVWIDAVHAGAALPAPDLWAATEPARASR
jgi:nicotinamidase-related amidase